MAKATFANRFQSVFSLIKIPWTVGVDDTIVKSDWKDGWFVRMGKNENNVNEATNEEHENEQTIN